MKTVTDHCDFLEVSVKDKKNIQVIILVSVKNILIIENLVSYFSYI